ncbi:MAG: YtjB family periplasmic protein [Shewanella sp.]
MLRVKVLYFKGLKISHKISRLLQIAIALSLLVGLIQLWESSLLQGQLLLKSQTQKMARLLVQQTAYSAAPALQLQNDEQLQWLANALVEDPKVVSAAIFSEQGIRLSFAQSLTHEEFGSDPDAEEMSLLLSKYPPYVEPVIQEGKNLGYVEVRLDTKLFFNEIKEAHNLNMEQQQMMLLIAGLIGMLLSRALSFKRADFDRRRTRAKLRKNPKKEKSSLALGATEKPALDKPALDKPETQATQDPAAAKVNANPQTAKSAKTGKPKVKMVHQAHAQSQAAKDPAKPSDLDTDTTG